MGFKAKRSPGEGSVYYDRSTKRWRSEIQFTDCNGKVIRKRFSGKLRREAEKSLGAFRREMLLAGENAAGCSGNMTFGELCSYWLQNIKRHELKAQSYTRLCQTVGHQLLPFLGEMSVRSIRRQHIQAMINSLSESGLSYSTVIKAYQAAKCALDTYREEFGAFTDPCAGIRLPKAPAGSPKYYTAEECRRILAAAYSKHKNGSPVYRLGGVIALLMFTGLRAGELIALRWEDVDFEKRLLRITKSAGKVPGKDGSGYRLVVDSPKSTRSIRTVPLCDSALEALENLRKVTFESGLVAAGKNGGMLDPRCLDDLFYSVQKRAGTDPTKISGVHTLRHTFASLLYYNGADIATVSRLLGHSGIAVTGNIYLHISGEQFAREVCKLDLFRKI